MDRIYIAPQVRVREEIMEEAYKSRYTIHPGFVKMYQDSKKNFLWPRMKRDVTNFVSRCLTCQKIKIEH